MISSDCIHISVVSITRGRIKEEVDFYCGVLQWRMGERFSREKARRIFGIWESFGGGGVCCLAGWLLQFLGQRRGNTMCSRGG